MEGFQERDQIERQCRTQVASFLNDDGRQRELRDGTRRLREAFPGHFEHAERVVLRCIEPERDDQRRGREGADAGESSVERLEKRRVARAVRQRQVQIEAEPGAAAGLLCVPSVEREVVRRVGVNLDRQDFRALVEDALRAVAVMHVDVEDRDTPASLRAQALGRLAA